MEKIYMENEKKSKKKSFFNKFFNDKGSMTAFVVVAFVGVLSLMVFGFRQISFAAGETSTLPDSFTADADAFSNRLIGENSNLAIVAFFYTKTDGTNEPVFCLEKNIAYGEDSLYTKDVELTDQGLIYLMSQLYPNKSFTNSSGQALPVNQQVWLSQSAIWVYLYEAGVANNSDMSTLVDKVRNEFELYDSTGTVVLEASNGSNLYKDYGIDTLIAQAHNYRISPYATLSVNKNSDTISITNDNKYYQSDLISVVGSTSSPLINNFEGYSVDLSRAPQGTILVDESGNVYSDVSKMSPTSKFYVRIPVDKVTDENKNVEISVLGNFKMYGANYYVSGNSQKVSNVKLTNRSESKPLNIQLDYTPDVPDTGMSTAQMIYFIGLIVLLSGVGIIYANAKPQTSK